MKSKNIRICTAVVIFTIGAIVPFVDYLVFIGLFFLLIPLSLLFMGSVAYVIVSFLSTTMDRTKAIYFACLVPLYVGGQLVSTYAVNKIQRYRSEVFIREIEQRVAGGGYAYTKDKPWGITLRIVDEQNNFTINYSRGFLVKEIYDSRTTSWESHGWHD